MKYLFFVLVFFLHFGCRTTDRKLVNEMDGLQNHAISRSENIVKLCKLPKKVGICKALIPKFFFNVSTGECEEFMYGGCGGNENNFDSLEECQTTCQTE